MKTALLLVCLTTTGALATDAQDSNLDRATLVGLTGVGVRASLTSADPPLGLTQDRLQTAVELRLRRSGVRVLSGDEILSTPGYPELEMAVVVLELKRNGRLTGYSYTFTLHLLQSVVLSRDSNIRHVEGVTWGQQELNLATEPPDGVVRYLLEDVESAVDGFINDYLAANPRN